MRRLTHSDLVEKRRKLSEIHEEERTPVVVVLDNVRSLYNVGSIFRTSDGALVRKLILSGYTPRPPRKEIEKTALGATESVPWEYASTAIQAVKECRKQGYKIFSLELTDESISYDAISRRDFPLCLVVGNEITGVSKEVIEECDRAVEIPMFGIKQSLNVAVAYGIVLYELAKVWRSRSAQPSKALV